MKKALITVGGYSEIPLIKALHKLGYYVISVGNNPDSLGHQYSDKYINGDFSDKEFIYEIAKEENVDGIVSGCNDFATLSSAYAAEKLGLPGHDTYENAQLIHHKDKFMKFSHQIGISVPRTVDCKDFNECQSAAEQLGFPIILKPVDLTGGKGVKVCNSLKELQQAYEVAMERTRQDTVVIEEFVEGENHGAAMLVKNNKVVFCFIDNEEYYINKYMVSGTCYPSNVSEAAKEKLIKDVEAIFRAKNLADGVFHTQFIVNKEGIPVIIDPCRRAAGMLYCYLVQYSTEVDYATELVKASVGIELQDEYTIKDHNIGHQCVMSDSNGIYKGINIDSELKNYVFESMIFAKEDEVIDDYLTYKAGILFFECDTPEKLYDLFERFHDLATIEKA